MFLATKTQFRWSPAFHARAGRLEYPLKHGLFRPSLEQARPASEAEQIERLFLLGQIALRRSRPEEAIERFEAILALRPNLTRAKLELARAYYLAGADAKASEHFLASLDAGLPSSTEAAVADFLRQIDARKRWRFSASASVLPETERPDRDTVLIGGVPFKLDEAARSGSGSGFFVSGGGSFSHRLTRRWRGTLAASAASKTYQQSNWNERTASGEIAAARLFENGTASTGVQLGRVSSKGDAGHRSAGAVARTRWQGPNATRLGGTLTATRRRHDGNNARDGWRLALSAHLTRPLAENTTITIEPAFDRTTAKERHHASHLVGLSGRVSSTLSRGLHCSFTAGIHHRRHAGDDPLFRSRRVDTTVRLAMRTHHRSLRIKGLVPYVGYSWERNRSSVPVHEYSIQGLIVGVSRRF